VDRPEVFESLDRVVLIELRPAGLPVGVIPQLYAHVRGDGQPLSLTIAQRLLDPAVEHVMLLTGVVVAPLPHGEIDGPIGAAVLADALGRLGKQATVTAPRPMERALTEIRRRLNGDFAIRTDDAADASDVDAAVAVERLGRNRRGQHHSILGAPFALDPIADELIERLNQDGRLTVGIGDGGNEIGFGAIYDYARRIVPYGAECGCPCGDGGVTATSTELLFPVAVSNFGAYALTAAIGLLTDRPGLLPSGAAISDAIDGALAEGCLDGGTFRPGFVGDDGIPIKTVLAVLEFLRGITIQAYNTSPRHA